MLMLMLMCYPVLSRKSLGDIAYVLMRQIITSSPQGFVVGPESSDALHMEDE